MNMLFSIICTLLIVPTNWNNEADKIVGFWWTEGKKAKVEIYKEGAEYHGKIVWLKEPKNMNGSDKLDVENPDEQLRKRPIIGMNLIEGFVFDDGKWEGGTIYDPENGKTYDCIIKLKGKKLDVRGYIGVAMFGRTVTWEKVE